ncbi:hypothetical protein [Tautonia rosea]|uniref:hypothetical protein n=1 Tax=Tautonia rosea TaxID=2728037 RepID=UPI0014764268|nr:hypothetical protein [Tautonia rosea]
MSQRPTSRDESAQGTIAELAGRIDSLNRQAVAKYTPVVEDILRSGCRDVAHIERTLDGLLDFCGYPPVVELYRSLCRYYWAIDPEATGRYVRFFREMWDSEEKAAAEGTL